MTLYALSGLQKRYGSRIALDIEALTLSAGVSYALLGPNGSGKTTLLQLLGLLIPPSKGTLSFMGEPVNWRRNALHFLRRKVVFVEQHPIMFTTTVLQNVAYGPKLRGVPRTARNCAAERCLARVGLTGMAHRQAHQLSGGEAHRVAIARALACEPDVLLLDEPTAGVDVENQSVIDALIRDIAADKGITVVFSTHNPVQAERLAMDKIYLHAGRTTGPAAENRFPAELIRESGRMASLLDDPGPGRRQGAAFVTIDPEKIRVYTIGPPQPDYPGSGIPARIVQMSAENEMVRIDMEAGVLLTALLSAGDVRSAGFIAGDRVEIDFDRDAVSFDP